MFDSEFAPFTLQCEKIGRHLIDKQKSYKLKEWYEGQKLDSLTITMQKFELEIDNSDLEVNYYLSLLSPKPIVYSFDLRNPETAESFGQIYIRFTDTDNILVDNLMIVQKSKMEEIEKESENSELLQLPPPPKPPIGKKKNGN